MNASLLHAGVELRNEIAALLPIDHERAGELREIAFAPEIWSYMGMRIESEQDFCDYLAGMFQERELGRCPPFLVLDRRSDRIAGCTRYGYINLASEKCEIGWTWYGQEFWGTGLNRACKHALLSYGFERVGFRRIQFSADLENKRSQKAVERLGATREGEFRNNYIDAEGRSRHDVYYSLVREEWDEIKAARFPELSIAY
ncbi:MAG: GNAT family protein [Planctomycetota bacterium]